MALFKARTNLLTATLTRMEMPLGPIDVGEEQADGLLAEGAVTRFDWNGHEEFFASGGYGSSEM